MSYLRFVLVSHLRSGTHMLRTSLESHPAIVCQSEVFNSDDRQLPYPLERPAQDILDEYVYRPKPPSVQCVGFVLQAYHPRGLSLVPEIRQNPGWDDVWTLLAGMPDLRVIHLKRLNLLRRHLSHVNAHESGIWHDWDSESVRLVTHLADPPAVGRRPADRPAVTLNPGRLTADFQDVVWSRRRADLTLGHHPILEVIYERLCDGYDAECRRVQEFLGVSPVRPLRPAVFKLEERPLAEAIANYHELKHHFARTPWGDFFDE
jgi:hypothetical protein